MPLIESQKFYKDLEKGSFHPLYFLFGEEPYLVEQALQRIKWSCLAEGASDFNLNQFYASDCDITQVLDAVETLPMMAACRVVIVKEVQELSEKEWAQLEKNFLSLVESTVFVLTASKVDKRKKAIKTLIDKSVALEMKRPYENQIPQWIKYISAQYEMSIQDDAIHLLHKLVGHHLTEIDSELKKLKDYIGEKKFIEVSDVAAVVSRAKEESVFDFTNAIGSNDRVLALENLVHLMDQGQSEIGVVALIARHIRLLLMVKKGLDQGLYGAKLASYAQVPPYFVENYAQQSKIWNVRRLEESLCYLSETDKALKSSPLSSHIWLENLVLKICAPMQHKEMSRSLRH